MPNNPPLPTAHRVINLRGQGLARLKAPVTADISIDLSECRALIELPRGISTGSLNLSGCSALERLPAGINVAFLDLADCTALVELPPDLRLRGGRLNLRNCAQLQRLPPNLGEVAQLDLSGCLNVTEIPGDLRITSWIDIGRSGVTRLPTTFDHVGLRWDGVAISRRVAFEAHSLEHAEILAERNAEVRRVMIERVGYERFLDRANAQVLDRDNDRGGERRLLRIDIEGDEPLVCVSVQCPSTNHRFVLRVPPNMTTCHQAIAWTAGYDDAKLYKPVKET